MMDLAQAQRKRVIIYRSELLPTSETFIREQALGLTAWEPHLVGYKRLPSGIPLEKLPVTLLGQSAGRFDPFVTKVRRAAGLPAKSDTSKLQGLRADLIHAHFGMEGVDAWAIAKPLNLPMLVTLHGMDINVSKSWWMHGHGGFRNRLYPQRLVNLSRNPKVHFAAVSRAILARALDYGIPRSKVHLSYIGVDTYKFRPGPAPVTERNEVLFVGRLVEKKGCQYLLEAFSALQPRFPNHRLTIIGTGPLEAELKAYARDNNVAADFLGSQTSMQVRERLDRARVFCLPSITAKNGDAEGLPISILEAQSCGVPVVTSARGGAAEGILPGESGFAHGERDIPAMAEYLRLLLSEDALALRFSMAARTFATSRMDRHTCSQALEALYDKCSS